jgi:MoxR-like ATPase
VPGLPPKLAHQAVELVQRLRGLDLKKHPSVAETIDWARALLELNAKIDRASIDLNVRQVRDRSNKARRRRAGRSGTGN